MIEYGSVHGHLVVIGISHRNTPVEIREKFSMSDKQRDSFLKRALKSGWGEVILLSTCNRSEVLAVCERPEQLRKLFVRYSNGSDRLFADYGFVMKGRTAAEHFFEVAIGLDAQILGDLQIIHQVKKAYECSCRHNMTGKILHRLLQSIFRAHKRTRRETGLADGASTTAYAAVQYIRNHVPCPEDRHIVLVGTGRIGTIVCKTLMKFGVRNVTIVNRNPSRAMRLGEKLDLPVAGFDTLGELLCRADVVIVTTGSDSPVLHNGIIPPQSQRKELLMLDLSVPRNIDPELDRLPGIRIVNMDLIRDRVSETYRKRREQVPAAKAIIREELDGFYHWLAERRLVPAIRTIEALLEDIRRKELDQFIQKAGITNTENVKLLTHRITKKILAFSIDQLKYGRDVTGIAPPSKIAVPDPEPGCR